MLGEAAGFVFPPHPPAVHLDVEDSPTPGNDPRFNLESTLDRFRQTGSLRQVVSLRAVFDAHIHDDQVSARGAGTPREALWAAFTEPPGTYYARFIVMRNSAFVRHLFNWARSNSMASTTFMSVRTRRSR